VSDSLRDPESGLLNDAYFHAALEQRVAAARRLLRPFSIVLIDLSETNADLARLVADALGETLRESDTACRLAGGGFGLLLEDTPENGAVWTVERLRRALAASTVASPVVWAGVASYPAHALEAADILDRAGRALVQARDWTHGRIEVAGGD
jgi:diguanylate cyclase (GGDEF)-like protein